MDSKTSRYQSRILREMRQNTENPFSPPSSTGSHGTVTLTSQLSNLPDGESTRQPMMPIINTSVLGRTFPEWDKGGKENIQPSTHNNQNTASLFSPDSPRLRSHQQVLIEEDTMELNHHRGNVTTLLDTLSENFKPDGGSTKQPSFQNSIKSQPNDGFTANAARRVHRQSQLSSHYNMSSVTINQSSRSFFLPNFNHLNDFVSGTLRWSSLRNGTPIFVKHGRVHDRDTKTSLDHHADFEAVTIPRDEEQIFVSLDKIREEIQTLQEHDEFVSKQASDHVATIKQLEATLQEHDEYVSRQASDVTTIKQLQTRNKAITKENLELQATLQERDELVSKQASDVATIKQLQARNKIITKQNLELQQALGESEEELDSERALLDALQQKYEMITEERSLLKEDHLGLERQNEDLFNNNKVLQQKNAQLERENNNLRDEVAHLKEIVDNLKKKSLQESTRPFPDTDQSKLAKLAQNREPKDTHTIMSEMSYKTTTSNMDLSKQDNYTQQINLTEDIQLPSTQTNKRNEAIVPPALSQSAKRVLNNLCHDHECNNCMVCARIKHHRHESNGKCSKKTVRIERPVPASDRVRSHTSASTQHYEEQHAPVPASARVNSRTSASTQHYEDQHIPVPASDRVKSHTSTSTQHYEDHTQRPSQNPAIALAKVMKGLKDEERHIRTAMTRKQAVYDECDAAINKRLWKQLDAEIKGLRKRRDIKRDQIYDLHDVLEGQKANAQLMTQDAIDMTITSVLSRDPTWNGIMDY